MASELAFQNSELAFSKLAFRKHAFWEHAFWNSRFQNSRSAELAFWFLHFLRCGRSCMYYRSMGQGCGCPAFRFVLGLCSLSWDEFLMPIGPRAYWPYGLLALGPIGPGAYWPWGLLAQGPGPKLFHLAECVAPIWANFGRRNLDPSLDPKGIDVRRCKLKESLPGRAFR